MGTTIKWGILGAGDVCEVKSGPAFHKADHSELAAVMRRDGAKAKDFAARHGVAKWYESVGDLLNDDDIDAIYIATPPRYHLEHCLAALDAGKHVYLEKPMGMNATECIKIIEAEKTSRGKIAIAHYRRALPAFKKIGEIITDGTIGDVRFADVSFYLPEQNTMVPEHAGNWRVNPEISGGGLFHDLSPHLFDLLLVYFGTPLSYEGFSLRQNPASTADDFVQGSIVFKDYIIFRGCWCFTVGAAATSELLTITGNKGKVSCTFFGEEVRLDTDAGEEVIEFTNPPNIQLPMIQEVTNYFLGKRDCPCSTQDGLQVMELIDRFSQK